MRILHVIPGVAARYGGPSQVIYEMTRALRDNGIDAWVATTDADGRGRLPVETGKVVQHRGVPTVFFSRTASEAFKFSGRLARWLRDRVREFDVVHIHAVFSHSSVAAASASRRWEVPYVLRPLGSLDPWSLDRKRWQKRLLRALGVDSMLRGAAALHYTTEGERQLAESRLQLPPGVVIPIGVQTLPVDPEVLEEFRLKHPALGHRPYILSLARLHPKKQLERLIQAFSEAAGGDWRLVIAGAGEARYRQELLQLARAAGGDRVIFPGWLQGAVKAAVVAGSELVALTSRQENFGVAAAEALAYNVPVLLSHHVNLAHEILRAGGGWVVSLHHHELIAQIRHILASPEERHERGMRGGIWARDCFDWNRIAVQLSELYTRLAPHRESSVR